MLNPSYRQSLLITIVILGLAVVSFCKQHSTNFNVANFRRQENWAFVDRMHIDPGYMTVRSTVKFIANKYMDNAEYYLQLVAIPDSIWQRSLQIKCNKQQLNQEQTRQIRRKELAMELMLTRDKGYAVTFTSRLQVHQTETYHFVLRQCGKQITNHGYGRDAKLEVWIDVRNNQKHTSSGEELYGWLLPILLASACVILYLLFREREEDGDNWIKLALKISLAIGANSILFKYIGFLVYAHGSGVEHGIFDVFYLLLHATSDSILIVLLMLLSFGWTVTFKNARDFDLYVPLACMLGLVNIIMTMLNKIADGQHDKYHMFDSIPAYIMIGFRCVGLLVFFFGIGQSWLSLKGKQEQSKVKRYLIQMSVLGTVYLAFVPIGFIIVRFVGTRHKKEVMFFGVELVRFAVSYWLALMAGWKKSAYRSIIDESFMEKGDKFY